MSGGFWQQLPAQMQRTWPFKQRTAVEIECEEVSRKHSAIKKERGLASWEFQVPPQNCCLTWLRVVQPTRLFMTRLRRFFGPCFGAGMLSTWPWHLGIPRCPFTRPAVTSPALQCFSCCCGRHWGGMGACAWGHRGSQTCLGFFKSRPGGMQRARPRCAGPPSGCPVNSMLLNGRSVLCQLAQLTQDSAAQERCGKINVQQCLEVSSDVGMAACRMGRTRRGGPPSGRPGATPALPA